MHIRRTAVLAVCVVLLVSGSVRGQAPADEDRARLEAGLKDLQSSIEQLRQDGQARRYLADVEVYAKAVEWILRHDEFYQPRFVQFSENALQTGRQRAAELAAGKPSWLAKPGKVIRGYVSQVDGSVQPYAVTIPHGLDPRSGDRWPLTVKLHGRGSTLNEVSFINTHDNKPLPEGHTWIELDVFGRTNNAYRWSGETDVFEALASVRRHYRVDDRRITLWGFSMGGAGAWHLGLHYPSQWSSVGPGAGFVDFYEYQNVSEPLPPYQDKTLRIYDATNYALNAFNVPVITYGGELDKQLRASTRMIEEAEQFDVEIQLLVGPETGHKFHPDSQKEFMEFHRRHSEAGRTPFPGREKIRFVTYTPKYNECEWVTIEELERMYEPAVLEGEIDRNENIVRITTENITALQIARDVAANVEIDGTELPLHNAADGLLPTVYYVNYNNDWQVLDYDQSLRFAENPQLRKRKNLQGPIDDAFMQSFICVRGTGTPWTPELDAWAGWTLSRFEREFDKWLRGRIRIVNDTDVTPDMITSSNLILFGDPGSNTILAQVLGELPVHWQKDGLQVDGVTYDPKTHGVSLIFPNPLNRNRYVVVNSGHTIREKDFKASNAWLFPKLGDIAVQKFERRSDGGYDETVIRADIFNSRWQLGE